MSVRVMSLVWDSNVPAPERFTLLALADRADEDGKCWPSIPMLTRKCMTSERSVQRHLRTLEELGVIKVQQRWNASSMYQINLPKLRELAQPSPTPRQSDTTPRQSDTGDNLTPVTDTTETPRQSDTRGCQSGRLSIKEPSRDTSGGAPARGTRIPDDFHATDAMKDWARQNTPLVGQAETDQFIDYWQSETGAKATKRDWGRAWKVWMRREQKAAERRPAHLRSVPAPQPKPSTFEAIRDAADCETAAQLLGTVWRQPAQPPDDSTPARVWLRQQRLAWIDHHEHAIRAALTQRSTA